MEKIRGFIGRDWSGAEKGLAIACAVCLGMVLGFLLAPIKKGITCGNYNGNQFPLCEDEDDGEEC